MVRSLGLSRLSLGSGLVRRQLGFPIQCGPVLAGSPAENVAHFSAKSSDLAPPASHPGALEKATLDTAAAARREYEKQTANLRKQYAAELAEKQKREQKDEELVRARTAELKAERLRLKQERSAARAIEVQEENRLLQEYQHKLIVVEDTWKLQVYVPRFHICDKLDYTLCMERVKRILSNIPVDVFVLLAEKEQRAINVKARNKLEARQGLIRHKRMLAVRRQSSMWIEERDLERRILEAISNPFHLRGSVSMGAVDRDDSYYEADEV
ncbi:hypothetical protein R1sor_025486 [Riccia sorocarpa]|uniref:Uncharacterized protein n=1 Tax=Riccia sorocarpa TaxID=122646 RepID=A0ABD3G8R6_9MARC